MVFFGIPTVLLNQMSCALYMMDKMCTGNRGCTSEIYLQGCCTGENCPLECCCHGLFS